MRTFLDFAFTKLVSVVLVVCIAALHVPALALTPKDSPEEALKKIQYEHYFRGKYVEAIGALQTFLARPDLPRNLEVSAREFLAASYILSGTPDKGKDQFLRLLNDDEQYAGPDPSMFKAEVMDAFTSTRDALASVKMRSAPETGADDYAAGSSPDPSKPIYKKWWFYAGLALVAVVVAAAAAPKEEEPDAPALPAGTVTVGVRIR
jgi:hypothetical protein